MRTSKSIRARLVAAGAAGILMVALAGCDTGESAPGEMTPAKTVSTASKESAEEPTAEETQDATVQASAGDIVSPEDAENLPEGQTAYPLETGDLIVVDINEELPDALVDEIRSLVIPKDQVYENFLKKAEGSTTAAWRKGEDIGQKTGRHVVIINEVASYDMDGTPERWYWGAVPTGDAYIANREDDDYGAPSVDAAIAKAEEYIATSDYPAAYELIIIEE